MEPRMNAIPSYETRQRTKLPLRLYYDIDEFDKKIAKKAPLVFINKSGNYIPITKDIEAYLPNDKTDNSNLPSNCDRKDICSDRKYCDGKGTIIRILALDSGPKSTSKHERGKRVEVEFCNHRIQQIIKS